MFFASSSLSGFWPFPFLGDFDNLAVFSFDIGDAVVIVSAFPVLIQEIFGVIDEVLVQVLLLSLFLGITPALSRRLLCPFRPLCGTSRFFLGSAPFPFHFSGSRRCRRRRHFKVELVQIRFDVLATAFPQLFFSFAVFPVSRGDVGLVVFVVLVIVI